MTSVRIGCEGPACNGGQSAADKEAAIVRGLPSATEAMRDDVAKFARGAVSKTLAITPHSRSGLTMRGGVTFVLFTCGACGYARVYGNTMWEA